MNIQAKLGQFEPIRIVPHIVQWTFLASIVGILAGSASALFLASLEWATAFREHHLWLLALLPLGGLIIGWVYHLYGKDVEAGNNLLIDEIHDPKKTVKLRMAPLVLIGTVATHFFGGSAGREGTAIQMGGSLADQLSKPFGLSPRDRKILLMAGVSGGFGSVFGVPLAGAVFGLEVISIGKLQYDAILACFVASLVGNEVTRAWGIHHQAFAVPFVPALNGWNLLMSIAAGAAFGLAGMAFSVLTHRISQFYEKKISYAPLRPFIGGIVVSLLIWIFGMQYAGLGIPTMVASFQTHLVPWTFALKLLMTALTLGAGYKGGEVTPLLFIGATLGNALAYIFHMPMPLLAGMGFVAVFAGAANTPISSTLMAIEIFGSHIGVYAGIACVVSYLFSGHTGIYHTQRIGFAKIETPLPAEGFTLSGFEKARLTLESLTDFTENAARPMVEGPSDSAPSQVKSLASLRIYFRSGDRLKHKGLWEKLSSPPLGTYLVGQARQEGIQNAMIHKVAAGFLEGEHLSMELSDTPPFHLPQCVELVDEEAKLRRFLKTHQVELKGARIALYISAPLRLDSLQSEASAILDPEGQPEPETIQD